MFNQFKSAMLDSKFQTTLMQNIAGAVIITTITTILPVGIKIVQEAIEIKVAAMKAEQTLKNEAVEAAAQ